MSADLDTPDLTIPARLLAGPMLGALVMGDPKVLGHTQRGQLAAIHHAPDATLLDCTQQATDPDGNGFTVQFTITVHPDVLVCIWHPETSGLGGHPGVPDAMPD